MKIVQVKFLRLKENRYEKVMQEIRWYIVWNVWKKMSKKACTQSTTTKKTYWAHELSEINNKYSIYQRILTSYTHYIWYTLTYYDSVANVCDSMVYNEKISESYTLCVLFETAVSVWLADFFCLGEHDISYDIFFYFTQSESCSYFAVSLSHSFITCLRSFDVCSFYHLVFYHAFIAFLEKKKSAPRLQIF